MANLKISALTALAVAPATDDLVPIVDSSDTTDAATGTTKKITVANLFTSPTFTDFTNANHDHGDADDGGQLTDAALSTAVGIAKGGTGQTAQTAAFDALAPTTTAGDTIYHNGSDNIRLAKGTAGQSLVMNDAETAPQWGGTGTKHVIGALENSVVKTYFNIQLLIILFTGESLNNVVTGFSNWIRNNGSTTIVAPGGAMADFISTSSAYLAVEDSLFKANATTLNFNATNKIIMDWWAKLPSTGTGDINMGFAASGTDFNLVYNDSTTGSRVVFAQKGTGELYATIAKQLTGVTNTDISSGLTLTNWNNYRIELDLSNNALFYINGVLKTTLSGANLPSSSSSIDIGYGRSDTSLFTVTAPHISLEMNL